MVEKRAFWQDNNEIRSPQVLIMLRRAVLLIAMASMAAVLADAQQQKDQNQQTKPADPDVLILKAPAPPPDQPQMKPELKADDLQKRAKLTEPTKMKLMQLLDAELAHTRKILPLGEKNTTITPDGLVKPADSALFQSAQVHGGAKVGDRVQVTNIAFRDRSVYVEINGGPKKKTKWYNHISISAGGGGTAAPDDSSGGGATGSAVTLQFAKYVPEMTGEELEKLLSPVLDFSVKSASQVYIDTMPPKVKEAMKKHEVLVGMNKDMVVMAKDRPEQKVRDKDANGKDYEDWIYGAPPKDVTFVRFRGDEVVQVKIARVGQEMIVKTQKEVDVKDGVVAMSTLAASNSPQDVKTDPGVQPQTPTKKPTLRREGEQPDPTVNRGPQPGTGQKPSDHGDEPQWGSDKDKDSNSQDQPKPPE